MTTGQGKINFKALEFEKFIFLWQNIIFTEHVSLLEMCHYKTVLLNIILSFFR